jgi:PTH1 family peptidyl-tRNA hydrolase
MSYLLIGLGNPTKKFDLTRHNVGKLFAGWLKKAQVQEGELEIVQTECFMNESGGWVKRKISNLKFQISNLIIVHDDLDIPLGKFKIQFGKGPRLHNGVLSVEQTLGTKEFWRIRIGIDSRLTGYQANRLKNADSGEDYVLERFKPDEKKMLEVVFPEIRDELEARIRLPHPDFIGTRNDK